MKAAIELVQDALNTTPHGVAKTLLDDVLERVEQGLPIERTHAESIFAHLVLDDRWAVDDARFVYHAVFDLAARRGEVRHV